MTDLADRISRAFYQHRQFYEGHTPTRLKLGRKEYEEFLGFGLDEEALGMRVTEEDCDSILVVV